VADSDKNFVPPYGVPWETFKNTIEKMAEDGLPERVDRSYLSSQSGNVQTYLMQAMRSFGLIEEDGTVTDLLKELTAAGEDRPQVVARLLHAHFSPIVILGASTATQGQLEEKWTEVFGQTGDTRRKAVRWFLSACAYAGINLSKLWKAPRAAAPGTSRKAKGGAKKANGSASDSASTGGGGTPPPRVGHSLRSFRLPSGGTLTISLDQDVLSLERVERKFVMGLIDQTEEYVEANPFSPSAPDGDEEDAEV
jgi:hypothetical protein